MLVFSDLLTLIDVCDFLLLSFLTTAWHNTILYPLDLMANARKIGARGLNFINYLISTLRMGLRGKRYKETKGNSCLL